MIKDDAHPFDRLGILARIGRPSRLRVLQMKTRTRTIKWVRQWGRSDVIVWIDVAKLNASWKHDRPYYIARGARSKIARPESYRRAGEWAASGQPVKMPHIGFEEDGTVTFTDGRHRFAWMRDHGVRALPVTTEREEAKEIARRFGSAYRTCQLPMSKQ
jgi:hypothetical protein